MWKPAPPTPPFNWGLVKASYPHAYRALFAVADGAVLNTQPGEAAPHWYSVPVSEEQLLSRDYTVVPHTFRRFVLSDLFTFFHAYQYVFSVRGLRTSSLADFPVTWRYGYVLRTPTRLVGRDHPDGHYPFASHEIAQHAAFLMAFDVLDTQLRHEQ